MTKAVATLRNHRQSPRKVRVVSDLIKGKKVSDAMSSLEFTTKRASLPILNLLKSAISNAKVKDLSVENLVVENIRVDGGAILYRRMPVAHGSSHPIRKRTSHVTITLSSIDSSEGLKEKKTKRTKKNLENK